MYSLALNTGGEKTLFKLNLIVNKKNPIERKLTEAANTLSRTKMGPMAECFYAWTCHLFWF